MIEYVIDCPCCKNKLKVQIDGSGIPAAFLFEEKDIHLTELAELLGLEFGVVEIKDINSKEVTEK